MKPIRSEDLKKQDGKRVPLHDRDGNIVGSCLFTYEEIKKK